MTTASRNAHPSVLGKAADALARDVPAALQTMSPGPPPYATLIVALTSVDTWKATLAASEKIARQFRVLVVATEDPVSGPEDIRTCFQKVSHLLALAAVVFPEPRVVYEKDLLVYSLLNNSTPDERTYYLDKTIRPILDLPDGGAALLKTMGAIHTRNGVGSAAAALGINVRTAYNHLARIRELSGSYRTPADRFRLELALYVLKLQK